MSFRQIGSVLLILTVAVLGSMTALAQRLPTPSIDTRAVKRWEHLLRHAGASPGEMLLFQDLASDSAASADLKDYLEKTPVSLVLIWLQRMYRNEHEHEPIAAYPSITTKLRCDELKAVSISDTTIEEASLLSDDTCRVTAKVIHLPAQNPITVWIALPMKWNGRFRGTGGGGYAGGYIESLRQAKYGYVIGVTDTGNPEGTANFAMDASGRPAWNRMRDNAYRGIHDMTLVGKALTRVFYGVPPKFSYFVGGSTGGRQALTEAERYPGDYDGILALYPAMARDRYVPAQLWPEVVMNTAGDFLSHDKLIAATDAAVRACGNGTKDIDDPTQCDYDPRALIGVRVKDTVFTKLDADVIRAIWEGPKAHDGSFLWWGPSRGTDLSVLADTEGSPLQGKPCEEGLDWFKYFLVLDPNWDWHQLTKDQFQLLFEQSAQEYGSTYGGDDPNLSEFHDHGGKLLMAHGWADQAVPAQKTIAYYRDVERRLGDRISVDNFFRLFLVPGADHGFGNDAPAPSQDDLTTALMNWVEHGKAPDRLFAEPLGDPRSFAGSRVLTPLQ